MRWALFLLTSKYLASSFYLTFEEMVNDSLKAYCPGQLMATPYNDAFLPLSWTFNIKKSGALSWHEFTFR